MKKMIMMGHALILAAAFALTGSIAADSACKGLGESECKGNDNCTWVSGYSQKDGDKVKAYCRAKPGKGDSAEKKSKKKKEKSEEAVKSDDTSDKADKKEKKAKKKKEKKEKADKAEVKDEKKEKKEKKNKKKKKKNKDDDK